MEYGIIPQVSGKGHAAKNVWNLMNKMLKEQTSKGCKKLFSQISQIDHLLLIDRSVDLITPMATQLTYEGLIDELFGINNSMYLKCSLMIKSYKFRVGHSINSF